MIKLALDPRYIKYKRITITFMKPKPMKSTKVENKSCRTICDYILIFLYVERL